MTEPDAATALGRHGPGPVLVLIGPPGSGKSTVGSLVAQQWGVPWRDTDAEIERAQGRSISDIFVEDGEATFRRLERAEVLTSLTEHPGVLSLGGGAVMDESVQQALRGHRVVFLDVGIADAASRVGFDASRPMLVVNPRASWLRLMKARRHLYESLSTSTVDTAGRTAADVAAAVMQAVGSDD